MKHRWIAVAAVTAILVLGACTPADSGVEGSSEGTTTTPNAEPSATSTPYVIDEY